MRSKQDRPADHLDPNKFPGKCYRCGKRVTAGQGSFRFVSPESLGRKSVGVLNTDIGLLEHLECREAHEGTSFSYLYPPVKKSNG